MVADIEIAILADNGDFLTLNKSAGIEIGRHGNAMLQLMLYAANDTTKRELAVQFDMNINAILNVTEDNYYVYVHIPSIYISNTKIVNDKVGMLGRNYDELLSLFMGMAQEIINEQFKTPYDFRVLDPQLMFFITSVFRSPRVSPFYLDNFIYLGISYQFDFAMTHSEKKIIENRILAQHSDKLTKVYTIAMDHIQKVLAWK